MCHHCKRPRKDHIRELAKSLVGTDVPEVKSYLKEQVPVDFDGRGSYCIPGAMPG